MNIVEKHTDKELENLFIRACSSVMETIAREKENNHPINTAVKGKYEEIKEAVSSIIESRGGLFELSDTDFRSLGFKSFAEDSEILLIPLCFFDLIPDGTVLYGLDDNEVAIKGIQDKDLDMDTRLGVIPFGIKTK